MLGLLVRAIRSDEHYGALRRNAMMWLTSVQPPASFIDDHSRANVSDPGAYRPEAALPAYEINAKSDLHARSNPEILEHKYLAKWMGAGGRVVDDDPTR